MSHVRVKICGVTTPADAELAASLGADAVGLNFYSMSPRYLTPDAARSILQVLPASVEPVALYVNEPLAEVARLALAVNVSSVQYHGDHRELIPPGIARFIPAFPVRDASSLHHIRAYVELLRSAGSAPAAVLVDAHVPGMHGGTGRLAPWHLLADFDPGAPLILAGGLTADNVAEAVRVVRPYAVDVASGVESAPGKKDPDQMRRFIDAVRSEQ